MLQLLTGTSEGWTDMSNGSLISMIMRVYLANMAEPKDVVTLKLDENNYVVIHLYGKTFIIPHCDANFK